MAGGYNPVRWNCERQGCFNKLKRPKIEVFHDCFPGKINFGDVDGIVEINGRGLVLEWKGAPMSLSKGQRIMWSRLTRGYFLTLLVAAGNAETMVVTHSARFVDGEWRDWVETDLDQMKSWIKVWADWAGKQRLFEVIANGGR